MPTKYQKDHILRSVWLVIDVPGMAAERIPELKQAMRKFADEWFKDDKTEYYPHQYARQIGVAEKEKLRIFVQER